MLLEHGPITPWIHACDHKQHRKPWNIQRRRLAHWLLVTSLGGSEQIRTEGREFAIGPGQTYLIEPGDIHDLGSAIGNSPAWIHFDLVFDRNRATHPHASGYDSELGERRRWLQPDSSAIFGIRLDTMPPPALAARCAEEVPAIIDRWRSGGIVARHDAAAGLWRLILAWAEHSGVADTSDPLDRAAAVALGRLESIGVEQLAAVAGLSRSGLSPAWRRRFGCAPGVWLRRQRLERAARLLARPELGLEEIARQCGWADATVLIRAWRDAHGCTPRSALRPEA
jgi:AraC-like DNA-binding protein